MQLPLTRNSKQTVLFISNHVDLFRLVLPLNTIKAAKTSHISELSMWLFLHTSMTSKHRAWQFHAGLLVCTRFNGLFILEEKKNTSLLLLNTPFTLCNWSMSYKHTNPRPKGFDEVIYVHWLCLVKDPTSATPDQVPPYIFKWIMDERQRWKGKGICLVDEIWAWDLRQSSRGWVGVHCPAVLSLNLTMKIWGAKPEVRELAFSYVWAPKSLCSTPLPYRAVYDYCQTHHPDTNKTSVRLSSLLKRESSELPMPSQQSNPQVI